MALPRGGTLEAFFNKEEYTLQRQGILPLCLLCNPGACPIVATREIFDYQINKAFANHLVKGRSLLKKLQSGARHGGACL